MKIKCPKCGHEFEANVTQLGVWEGDIAPLCPVIVKQGVSSMSYRMDALRCPKCGSTNLRVDALASDSSSDNCLRIAECRDCGWKGKV